MNARDAVIVNGRIVPPPVTKPCPACGAAVKPNMPCGNCADAARFSVPVVKHPALTGNRVVTAVIEAPIMTLAEAAEIKKSGKSSKNTCPACGGRMNTFSGKCPRCDTKPAVGLYQPSPLPAQAAPSKAEPEYRTRKIVQLEPGLETVAAKEPPRTTPERPTLESAILSREPILDALRGVQAAVGGLSDDDRKRVLRAALALSGGL